MSAPTPRGNRVPTDLDWMAERLRVCLEFIEANRGDPKAIPATCLAIGSELCALIPRLWRAAK